MVTESLSQLFANDDPPKSPTIARIPPGSAPDSTKAYEPKLVSIGPCYDQEPKLRSFLKYKLSFLDFFTKKVEEKGIAFKQVREAVSNLQGTIRGSYSQDIDLPSDNEELVDMMIRDGSFILMLFTVFCEKISGYPDDDKEFFENTETLQSIGTDLLLLGNQVPYVVLETLFQTSGLVSSCGLNQLALEFFGSYLHKPATFGEKHSGLQASNLLDLIRKSFIPVPSVVRLNVNRTPDPDHEVVQFISSAYKLRVLGIGFKPKNSDAILDVTYNNGVVHIPPVVIDSFMISVLSNCLAYERLDLNSSNHMRSYAALMSCLIRESEDVEYLYQRDIIKNCLGSQDLVFDFFKSFCQGIGTEIKIDQQQSYLKEVFQGVAKYSKDKKHTYLQEFKDKWCKSPLIIVGACAGFIVFLFAVLGGVLGAYRFFHPAHKN